MAVLERSAGAWVYCPLCRCEFGSMKWCPFDGCLLRPLDVARAGDRDGYPDFLETVQLSWGCFVDVFEVHLVRGIVGRGTPGQLLCGIDQHAKDGPGFSVGGGVSGPSIHQVPCPGCVAAARAEFPGVPIVGMRPASEPIAAAVGAEVYFHSADVPAYQLWLNRSRRT